MPLEARIESHKQDRRTFYTKALIHESGTTLLPHTDVLKLQDVKSKIELSPWPWPAEWSKWVEILHARSNRLN